MGSRLVSFYRSHVKKTWKIAFVSAAVMGMLVHLYKFTNNLPFFDSYYNAYSSQNMAASGRWFLSAACALSSYFDLPWLIGIFSVLFMALTAVVVTEIFEMENPCLILVSSGLLVSYPAITETMFFEYTADGYMLAMLLGALAVYFSRMECCGNWKNFGVSVLCICLSSGIYQCYVSFAFILAVCYFIGKLLEEPQNTRKHLSWVGFQAGVYILGLLAYFVIWKLLLRLYGIDTVSYQGISSVGKFELNNIASAAVDSITSFIWFLLERNPLHQGWTAYSALSCLTAAVFFVLLAAASMKRKIYRSGISFTLLLLCVVSIPFGCYLCYFISSELTYYTRMMQSVVILFIFTGVLCERWIRGRGKDLVLGLLVAVTLNHCVMANVCYNYLDRSYEKAYAVMNEIAARIHMEDDGTVKYIAFLGTFDPVSEDADVDDSQLGTLGPLKLVSKAGVFYHDHMMLFLSQYTDFTLSYYRIHAEQFPLVEIPEGAPVPEGYEFRFPIADTERTYALQGSAEVSEMGIWPQNNSVKRIGDTIVVKLSENEV